jgi:hypothetical protein
MLHVHAMSVILSVREACDAVVLRCGVPWTEAALAAWHAVIVRARPAKGPPPGYWQRLSVSDEHASVKVTLTMEGQLRNVALQPARCK